jgi:Concanavalin A-like lectin/glucanases superfamily/OSK domain
MHFWLGAHKQARPAWRRSAGILTAAVLAIGGGSLPAAAATSGRAHAAAVAAGRGGVRAAAAKPVGAVSSKTTADARPAHLQGPRLASTDQPRATGRVRAPRVVLSRLTLAERAAYAIARRTGRPAVVAGKTTATTQLSEMPGGMLKLVSNAMPVRVHAGGKWLPISTTLRKAGGSWSAQLTPDPVTFSGGGIGPMVTLRDSGVSGWVSLYWPGWLPRPVVSGSVALYKNVLPGVDLRLEATSSGYRQVLVVRSAAAARDAGLVSIKMKVQAGGKLVLRRGPEDVLNVVLPGTRETVFIFGQSQMWDSSKSQHINMPATADFAGSGRVSMVPERYIMRRGKSATIELAPAASALAGAQVRYPLYIDPTIDNNQDYYAQVLEADDGSGYTQAWTTKTGTTSQPNGATEIGYCGFSNCVWAGHLTYTDRDYFRFDTSDFDDGVNGTADVSYADFVDEQIAIAPDGCTAEDSSVYESGAISASTTWPGPQEGSSPLVTVSSDAGGSGSSGSCKFNNVSYSNSALASWIQSAIAAKKGTTTTLELRATSESNELQYKLYSDNPSLTIYYNFAPETPTLPSGPPYTPPAIPVDDLVTCASTYYTSDNTPTFAAYDLDGNPSNQQQDVTLTYTVQTSTGGSVSESSNTVKGKGNGTSLLTDTPSATLSNGAYRFEVMATNDPTTGTARSSGETSWYDFAVLHQTPPTPTIASHDYPQNYWDATTGTWLSSPQAQWGQPQGAPGSFTVGANGGTDIAGFAYSFDNSDIAAESISDCSYLNDGGLGTSMNTNGVGGKSAGDGELAVGPNGTAQILIPTGLASGEHTLYVESFDGAHNMSQEQAYSFYVAPDYQSGQQTEPVIAGSSLVTGATGANASLLTTQSNCCGLTWDGNSQLIFNGTAVGQTFTLNFTVPGSSTDTWQLGADMTTSYDYAEAEVELVPPGSGTPIPLGGTQTAPWDGYNPVVSLKYLDLGTQVLTGGQTYGLMFTVTGKDPDATGSDYQLGLNYLTLSPTNRYEAESLTTGTPTTGTVAPQYAAGQGWSGNGQLLFTNTTQNASYTLNFSVAVEADYALGVVLTEASSHGQVRLDLDPATTDLNLGNTATDPIDTYSATAGDQYAFLGGVHLSQGQHVLKVTVVGTNASSSGDRYDAGIDFVEAAPVTSVSDTSLTTAMNNLGIAPQDSGSFAGNFDGTTGDNNLSEVALSAAGVTVGAASAAGSSFSLNGVNFTMPELQSSSGTVTADNVIAAGQTIGLLPAQQISATDAALLVAVTCNVNDQSWATSPRTYATVNYAAGGPGPGQDLIAPVPDWVAGPTSTAIMVLSHRDAGTTPVTGAGPRLYEVMLPANPAGKLASVTLPLVAGGYLSEQEGCSGPQLHVLAIGVRPVSTPSTSTVWDGAFSAPMDEAIAPWNGSLAGTTMREIITPSSAGSGQVRIQLSNAHSLQPVKFDQVTVAAQASAGGPAAVASTMETVTVGGTESVTIPAGGDAFSDAMTMPTGGSGSLVISMYVDSSYAVTSMPIHLAPNQEPNLVTFWASGNDTTNTDGTDYSNSDSNAGDDYIAGVDVSDTTTTDGTVVVLGDQTTTQAPQYSIANWPWDLSGASGALASDSVALPGAVASTSTSGTEPTHWWGLTGEVPLSTITKTGYDSGSAANDTMTLQNTAAWTTDNPGTGSTSGSLSLDGSSGYAKGSGPAVTTTSSFTATAWAKLSSLPTSSVTVAAQNGNVNSAFSLGVDYTGGTAYWAASFPASDTSNAASTVVLGPAATAGTWTSLAVVYDEADANGQCSGGKACAELYVNGALVSSVAVTPWAASGSFVIGADQVNGTTSGYFPGEISDVRTFASMLWGTGISEVYNDNGTSTLTTANAIPAFENITEAEPNVRDVVIALGANDVLQGASVSSIEANLSALVSAISARTSADTGNAVQPFLTTIPPLGLASTDARETVREAVNGWIMNSGQPDSCPSGGYGTVQGAGGSVLSADLACAVANPSSVNNVNPSLLSSGVPTSQYYTDLAQAFAEAVENSGVAPGVGGVSL